MHYIPPQSVLEKYADLLVNFALGNTKGIKKGEVVQIVIPECAKPLLSELRKAVLAAGGHVLLTYLPDDEERYSNSRDFYLLATEPQLTFFPEKYLKGLVDQIDHILFIIAEADMHRLEGVDPKKIMAQRQAYKPYMDWRRDKENQGKLSWTIAMYGTPAMATEAGLSLEAYWDQITQACFLDDTYPILTWQKVTDEVQAFAKTLTDLPIQTLHITGSDANLQISLGKKRRWEAGRGANIPSFEVFTSPDWRGTQGWIRFNQPLHYMSQQVEGVFLRFEKGRVVESSATKNEDLLKEMIATPGADKIGEFSLTDGRHSRITHFMAETLFDENMGGPEGNTHIALGMSYHNTYKGDLQKMTADDWERLGYNDSVVHTDIISTARRTVTATLTDGTQQVIYENGKFKL